jgi:hypothetical protein
MITTKNEYEFVNFKDNITINGEIMPLREGDRKNHLRGEDPAFLLEAQGERWAALWGFTNTKKQMTKEIQGARLQDIVRQFMRDADLSNENFTAYFIKSQLPTEDKYGLQSTRVAEDLGLRFTTGDFKSKIWNFEQGSELKRLHMENLFEDADMLRIPFLHMETTKPGVTNFYNQLSLSYSVNKGSHELAYPVEPNVSHNALYQYVAWGEDYGHDGNIEVHGGWWEATVNGGTLSYNINATRTKWLKPITRTICICTTRVQYYKGGESQPAQDDQSNVYDMFSCPSTQTGSTVTLDLSGLVSGAKRFLSHYHFNKKHFPFYGHESATVLLAYIIPVCEMDDHTRWNTTP